MRFGFKIWCIPSSKRYHLHEEPYCGVDTDLPDTILGQGADVVLGLIDKFEVKAGSTVKFDNLFTSLPLLDEVTELRIDAFDKTTSMAPRQLIKPHQQRNTDHPMILLPMVNTWQCLGW